jgi:AAA domain
VGGKLRQKIEEREKNEPEESLKTSGTYWALVAYADALTRLRLIVEQNFQFVETLGLLAVTRYIFELVVWLRALAQDRRFGLTYYFQMMDKQIRYKGRRTFNLQADLVLLENKIREIGDVALIIIDPISSYMGKTDSHKNSEVRGALEPLSEMAERMKVAVLSITHFSKAGSGNTNKALHRFIGSIAFVGAPRAALAVIEDADNEGRILFLHAKNNMAPKPQGLAYRLLQTIVCHNIVASYVHWEDTPVTISADQALGAAESTGSRTTKEEATDFLRDILGQGEVPSEEVQQAARRAGITPKPLRSAREALKVRSRREGFGPGAVWYWSLPSGPLHNQRVQPSGPLMPSPPIDAQPRDRASMDPEGIYDTGFHNLGVNGAAPVLDGDPRDCGPMPECLIRRVPPDRRPALGPPGDSLDDLR